MRVTCHKNMMQRKFFFTLGSKYSFLGKAWKALRSIGLIFTLCITCVYARNRSSDTYVLSTNTSMYSTGPSLKGAENLLPFLFAEVSKKFRAPTLKI